MTGTDMFREFISLIGGILSSVFISKFRYLFIAVGASIGTYIISLVFRWFNHA